MLHCDSGIYFLTDPLPFFCSHLLSANNAFHRTNVCGIDGCRKVCTLRNRVDSGRLTYYCAGGLDIDENGNTVGHPGRKSRVCTYNSVFYNRKCLTNYTLSVMYDYLKDSSITNICNSHGMSRPAVTSLANDLRLMMLSDYNAHNRQEEHKLGSNKASGSLVWLSAWSPPMRQIGFTPTLIIELANKS
ncbi:hypothetical protein G6F48_013449 [Rhizopus delemar]|nr:hypothetical protein G6F48_013449 [Rhizopus delemar]